MLQWGSKDNIDYTWRVVEMIEDRILVASSFVDKGNIHMRKGWGDKDWVVFGLANKPAVAVGEEKAAHNLMLVRAAEGMVRLDNNHMDNQQFEKAEKGICPADQADQVVECGVVIELRERPALGTY